jgi:hypothetical protein
MEGHVMTPTLSAVGALTVHSWVAHDLPPAPWWLNLAIATGLWLVIWGLADFVTKGER